MDYRDPETARRRSIFHQRIQIGFPGRSFVVDLQSYFSSLLSPALTRRRPFTELANSVLVRCPRRVRARWRHGCRQRAPREGVS
ncbi:hypothetical protein DGN07_17655 [Xanthomonas citri pv. fuscans]|nr:hypothetical protein DGN07_17655 [Xanthomonas citri pv. fuscans]